MLTKEEAQQQIYELINQDYRVEGDYAVILEDETITLPYGWVFFWDSYRHQQDRDWHHQWVGNSPFVMEAESGEITALGTALLPEQSLANYEKTRKAKMKEASGQPAGCSMVLGDVLASIAVVVLLFLLMFVFISGLMSLHLSYKVAFGLSFLPAVILANWLVAWYTSRR